MPRKIALNWFIPAFVKRSVGSERGTTDDEGTVFEYVSSNSSIGLHLLCCYQKCAHSSQSTPRRSYEREQHSTHAAVPLPKSF